MNKRFISLFQCLVGVVIAFLVALSYLGTTHLIKSTYTGVLSNMTISEMFPIFPTAARGSSSNDSDVNFSATDTQSQIPVLDTNHFRRERKNKSSSNGLNPLVNTVTF